MIRLQTLTFEAGKRTGGSVLYVNPAHIVKIAGSISAGVGAIVFLTDGSRYDVSESPEHIRVEFTMRGR